MDLLAGKIIFFTLLIIVNTVAIYGVGKAVILKKFDYMYITLFLPIFVIYLVSSTVLKEVNMSFSPWIYILLIDMGFVSLGYYYLFSKRER